MPATAGISSISALMAALCAVIGGAVMLSGRRRPSHQTFLYFSTSLFLWHLFSVFRDLRAPLALAALLFVPVTLILFLRTWLRVMPIALSMPISLVLSLTDSIRVFVIPNIAIMTAKPRRAQKSPKAWSICFSAVLKISPLSCT